MEATELDVRHVEAMLLVGLDAQVLRSRLGLMYSDLSGDCS